ncbi:NUDIX hydrolase [Haladaptatus sp. W1]|uniref:NUDIX hydrolase n=1 Tax=Haladaptatus sp. W1 TaxID=1897478 RepID=UPI000849772A|nr:NUDIX domain-containing protein [Haladaptatus sp. W1]ODR81315.1 NUDIX hydrolase [Haladaptatus sp. W1]
MTLDELWFLATEAEQRAEQAYHRLTERHTEFLEFTRNYEVSRGRFRTLANRVSESGAPYGAHTIVYRPSRELLLVWHAGVDMWVLPGGGIQADETYREAAERELGEEAGVEADYEGLAIATRTAIRCGDYSTWGVLPVFQACAETTAPTLCDPDGEITDAKWFAELPENTRDREQLVKWREEKFSSRA